MDSTWILVSLFLDHCDLGRKAVYAQPYKAVSPVLTMRTQVANEVVTQQAAAPAPTAYLHPAFHVHESELGTLLGEAQRVEEVLSSDSFSPGLLVNSFSANEERWI